MRAVIQRVSRAEVFVASESVSAIGTGLLVLAGAEHGDSYADVSVAVDKIAGLRIFADDDGRMNLSLADVGGEVLLVSQFTLPSRLARGRRPSFTDSAEPDVARRLLDEMATAFDERGISTQTGVFGAKMEVSLVNKGPVTFILDVRHGKVVGSGHLEDAGGS